MKADLVVRNARVVTHDGEFMGGVAVSGGRIAVESRKGRGIAFASQEMMVEIGFDLHR